MKANHWPDWLPKGNRISVKLTENQLNYIQPAFAHCRGKESRFSLDGVTLCNGTVSGHKIAIGEFLNRFKYFDLDLSNFWPK